MKRFPCVFFDGIRDNRVLTRNSYAPTWGDLADLLSTHTVTPVKEDAPMICGALFKTTATDYEPAPVRIRDPITGEVSRTDFPVDPTTNQPYVRRCGANVISYSWLAADFDGSTTLEAAVERFDGFAYILYTSHSHQAAGTDRFRVFFPFSIDCPAAEFEVRKRSFLTFLGSDDESSVSMSRGFFMPTCPAERADLAVAFSVEGLYLDWSAFAAHRPVPRPVVAVEPRPVGNDASLDRYVQVALAREAEKLRSTTAGNRHLQVIRSARSLGGFVPHGILSEVEIHAALFPAAMSAGMEGRDEEVRQAIEDGISYGVRKPRALPKPRRKRWTGIYDCPWVSGQDIGKWMAYRDLDDADMILEQLVQGWILRAKGEANATDLDLLVNQLKTLSGINM